ncbi:MAG: hypothetical protein AABZ60_03905, partial [Planctomycetota bacterium]
MVEYVIKKYSGTELDPTQYSEALLPQVKMDMWFELPKESLKQLKESPFPYLAEWNLVHIKAVNDLLTTRDVRQYLGELFIMEGTPKTEGKSVALTIITAKALGKNFFENSIRKLGETEYPWIKKVKEDLEIYIMTLEEMPKNEEKYRCFLPFMPIEKLREVKNELRKIKEENREEAHLIKLWLSKLQPEFYKEEIQMSILDTKEIALEFFPKTLENEHLKGK